jgi:hypothetical protein
MHETNEKIRKMCYEIPYTRKEHYFEEYRDVYQTTKMDLQNIAQTMLWGAYNSLMFLDWEQYEN